MAQVGDKFYPVSFDDEGNYQVGGFFSTHYLYRSPTHSLAHSLTHSPTPTTQKNLLETKQTGELVRSPPHCCLWKRDGQDL